jgi:hypothetical protein
LAHCLFDARPDRLDFRDLRNEPPLRSLPLEFPTTEQLAQIVPAYVTANLVLDQGRESACTGFGLADVVTYLLWLREIGSTTTGRDVRVSPHMLDEPARRYDEWKGERYEGSSCRGARADSEWDMDALKRPLGIYYRINKASVVDMQAANADIGAIYGSAQVQDGWDRVSNLDQAPDSHDPAALPTQTRRVSCSRKLTGLTLYGKALLYLSAEPWSMRARCRCWAWSAPTTSSALPLMTGRLVNSDPSRNRRPHFPPKTFIQCQRRTSGSTNKARPSRPPTARLTTTSTLSRRPFSVSRDKHL